MVENFTPRTEEVLLDLFAKGGPGAVESFEALVKAHGGMVYQTCFRVLGSREAAEDAAQASFMVLAQKAATVPKGIGAFLHGVAINQAKRMRDSESSRKQREKEYAEMVSRTEEKTSEHESSWKEVCPYIDEAIAALPEGQRTALVLHYLEGLSQAQVAKAMNVSLGTVASHLNRATARLRERLAFRGATLSVGVLVAMLSTKTAADECPAFLLSAAAKLAAARAGAASLGASAANVALKARAQLPPKKTAGLGWKVLAAALAAVIGAATVTAIMLTTPARPAPPTAPAHAIGPRALSAEDAWLRELLARAEAAPWDALDFGQGACAVHDWRMDARGGPAQRRIWNVRADTQRATGVNFDRARWKRGVLTGRVMMLADGQRPPETPDNSSSACPQWHLFNLWDVPAGKKKAFWFFLYQGVREKSHGSQLETFGAAGNHVGAWCRFALYFDTEAERGPSVVTCCWPEVQAGPPPAARWFYDNARKVSPESTKKGNPIGLGLIAYGCQVQMSALKLTPLGPDFSQPPKGLRVK